MSSRNKEMRFDGYQSLDFLDGRDVPIETAVTFDFKEGLMIHICSGHDNEIFDDENAYRIPFENIIDAALVWMHGYIHTPPEIQLASYLRYVADHLENEHNAQQRLKEEKKKS